MYMRIKLLIDASKGIEYLHKKGILHWDIEDDTFLVITFDEKKWKKIVN